MTPDMINLVEECDKVGTHLQLNRSKLGIWTVAIKWSNVSVVSVKDTKDLELALFKALNKLKEWDRKDRGW